MEYVFKGYSIVIFNALILVNYLTKTLEEATALGYSSYASTRAQSFDTGSVSVRLLVAVSQPTSYSAVCGDYSAIDTV